MGDGGQYQMLSLSHLNENHSRIALPVNGLSRLALLLDRSCKLDWRTIGGGLSNMPAPLWMLTVLLPSDEICEIMLLRLSSCALNFRSIASDSP